VNPAVLALDCGREEKRITEWLRGTVVRRLRRRGAVVAISGGIDSSVCAALAARALGAAHVLGLLMPERDSSPASAALAGELAAALGIPTATEDITGTLEAIGCYRRRDEAIRAVFPDYGPGWASKIAIAGGLDGRFNHFKLAVRPPGGAVREQRLPHRAYLQLVAAQNFKQRIRKTLEYFHADRLNYAVVGTPNLLEYDQGFFVKNGDGSADLKPIAHLHKTQVYAMARHLGLPERICAAVPTTDTYSLPQGQDEFYFALPYEKMDLALWAQGRGVAAAELAATLDISPERAEAVYRDIASKRAAAGILHAPPLVLPGPGAPEGP
jgi:NAD+ synthase